MSGGNAGPLPRNWVSTTVGEICHVVGGGTPSTERPEYWTSGTPWITSADIFGVKDIRPRRAVTDAAIRESATNRVPAGSAIVVTRVGLGKVGLAATDICFSQDCHGLVFDSSCIHPLFLVYHLQIAVQAFKYTSRGTTIAGVTKKQLCELPVVLPPLQEQQSIVAEIEKHATRLDAAVTSLQRARVNLKRYRASVLKTACEGRLVPTEAELARREGRDYEPASVLLDRTLRERRERREGQEKRGGKYREPQPPDTSNLPPLPEGWVWASIGQCFGVHVGATPSRARSEYWGGNIPWVSSGEVAFSRVRQTRETITENGFNGANLGLHPPGTVLLGMIGEGKTRGQVAILDIAACHNQNSAAIRVSETDLVPEYLYYFLWSEYEHVRKRGSGGNQPALNRSRVEEIAFPLPPLAEQRRIVAEVERHLSVIQAAEEIVEGNLKRADRLRQAILRRAFEGQLVPQDPTDEPASVLLERIRAEREHAGRIPAEVRRRTGRRQKAQEVSA